LIVRIVKRLRQVLIAGFAADRSGDPNHTRMMAG
jgi:hypothetical protein